MNKTERFPFRWNVKVFNWNRQLIENFDVLKYREDEIKKLKKKYKDNKEEFGKALRVRLMSQYWSRSEWEIIITRTEDERIVLSPWCGAQDAAAVSIDVTDDTDFDWKEFANLHISKQVFKDRAKVDVYDQIEYRWDDFLDFVWSYRHKYQRSK